MHRTPEQIRDDSDAEALEQAADVLRRRYGLLVAGDLIRALRDRAESIARGQG